MYINEIGMHMYDIKQTSKQNATNSMFRLQMKLSAESCVSLTTEKWLLMGYSYMDSKECFPQVQRFGFHRFPFLSNSDNVCEHFLSLRRTDHVFERGNDKFQ